MKDLTIEIEEKAKRYDEVIERAKKVLLDCTPEEQKVVEYISPELKESEDEKIRNEIIDYLERFIPHHEYDLVAKSRIWIAWLKKQKTTKEALQYLKENHSPSEVSDFQAAMNIAVAKAYNKGYADGLEKQGKNDMGISEATKQKLEDSLNKALEKETPESWNKILDEQNPTDKVEPKFKVGDWVVNKQNEIARINQIFEDTHGTQRYHIGFTDGTKTYPRPCDADDYYRLWTIQDAKDGDVLAAKIDKEPNDFIYIFKGHDQNGFSSYCYLDAYINKFHEGMYHNTHNVGVPATKEQRDLLFSKMKEAGYEWDAEKKELKKINLIKAEYGKYYYCIKDYFSGGKKFSSKGDIVQALRGWPIIGLEDISEYFLPVDNIQKSAWSEEDEERYVSCLQRLGTGNLKQPETINTVWLKSLKERVQPQPKWSEEDEEMRIDAIKYLEIFDAQGIHGNVAWPCIDWLKSLKERIQPQSMK